MRFFDKKTGFDLARLSIFMVITILATSVLVILIGNITFVDSRSYKAVFSDATGVVSGDDVRIAGVRVGTVLDVETTDGGANALVTFDVDASSEVTEATTATIRFRNLVGQRYISLAEGIGGPDPLAEDETIPIERTSPALDLTVLFNGFKPLFEALSPDDLNQLSFEIIQVFQGQGGTLQSLLASTASLTGTLADRDQVIGELIENLDDVLGRLADRDEQLSALILNFRQLVGGLAEDRFAILDSLDGISTLAVETSDLVTEIRPPLVADIRELRRFAANTDRNRVELDRALQVLPIKLDKFGRTAIYGSWFNFFLCDFRLQLRAGDRVILPDNDDNPLFSTGAARCDLG